MNFETAKAEFLKACDLIDAKAVAAQQQCLRDAWALIMKADYVGRDRVLAKGHEVPEIARKAKLEAGYRIAEKLGIDRDDMEREVKRILAVQ